MSSDCVRARRRQATSLLLDLVQPGELEAPAIREKASGRVIISCLGYARAIASAKKNAPPPASTMASISVPSCTRRFMAVTASSATRCAAGAMLR
jgi:hypothetical protein